jgi:hypothetical protein
MTAEHIIMPLHELAELAVLDAYGVLPDADLLRFEQAFLATSPEVQAELRRTQADIATDERLLPTCEPPTELRAKVLGRIRTAMDLSRASEIDADVARLRHPAMQAAEQNPNFLSSVWTWRMAALLLLGVVLTLVATNTSNQRHFEQLSLEAMRLQATHEFEVAMGDQYQPFMELMRRPDVEHAYLSADGGHGFVRLSIDETSGRVFVMAMDLVGHEGPCRLEVSSEAGELLSATDLRTDRYIDAATMEVDPAVLANATVRLVDGLGRTIATTRLT